MANGQVTTSASGNVGRVITLALVGLALTSFSGQVQASTGAEAALQGEAITSALGTVAQNPSALLLGEQSDSRTGTLVATGRSLVATAQGTAAPVSSLALQGLASQALQGLITPNADGVVPLLGTAITGETGSVSIPGDFELTGEESTAEAGTLTPVLAPNNSGGQELSSAAGAITPSFSSPIEAALSGVEATFAQGTFGTMTGLTGASSTSAAGTASPAQDIAITGQAINTGIGQLGIGQDPNDTYILSSAGFTTQSLDVALTGEASTMAQGSVTVSSDVEAALTGESATSEAGSVGVSAAVAAIGSESVAAQNPFGAPGLGELTGQAITMGQGSVSLTPDRTESLISQLISVADGSLGLRPSVVLPSQVLNGTAGLMGRSGGNIEQALTGAAGLVSHGSLGVIGQDITPPAVSAEGCSITTDISAEGCVIVKTASVESRTITARPAKEV